MSREHNKTMNSESNKAIDRENNNAMTEQRNERTSQLDSMDVKDILEVMNREDQQVALSVKEALPLITPAIEAIVDVLSNGGRLFYIGAGTSGRLGILDASECPPTFGVDHSLVTGIIAGGPQAIQMSIENAEDDEEAGKRDAASQVTKKDALVGITANGSTPYVLAAIRYANEIGAVTAGISCNRHTPLSAISQYPMELLVGPEVVTGSTRLKAGTAQKMVLNMITTTAMIKLGKVYGNLMVNVQATNHKLRERAIRIIVEATSADEQTARRVNELANGDVRSSILMIQHGIGYEEALHFLAQANQHFGKAMQLAEL